MPKIAGDWWVVAGLCLAIRIGDLGEGIQDVIFGSFLSDLPLLLRRKVQQVKFNAVDGDSVDVVIEVKCRIVCVIW